MANKYIIEIVIALGIGLAAIHAPFEGVTLYALLIGLIVTLKVLRHLDRKENPDFTRLKVEVKELKTKVEQLVLRGNR